MASPSALSISETPNTEPLKRQGSIRRILPSVANGDSMLGVSAKMIERPQPPQPNSSSQKQSYNQYFQEYSIISEYNMLVKHCLPGLYIIPAANSALLWFAVLFIRKGVYQGGVFRFNLLIPENFPDCSCPQILFETKVFHPRIDIHTGEMEVSSAFPDWKKDVNRLWQVLDYVCRSFYSIDTKHPLNQEAANLYEKEKDEFLSKVRSCVENSQASIYNPPTIDDPNYLKFDPYNEDVHGSTMAAIVAPKEEDSVQRCRGLSWVQAGSLESFSRPHS